MTAIRVRVPTPVREVDPATLLLISHPLGRLQPYLPRDIDAEFDRALAAPGLVLVPSAPFAGARRSAYEALMRNLPDAPLATHDEPPLDPPDAAVVWADYHARGRGAARRELPELQEWREGAQGRRVVVLLSDAEFEVMDPAELDAMTVRTVRVGADLSAAERSGLGERGMDPGISTVEDVFSGTAHVEGFLREDAKGDRHRRGKAEREEDPAGRDAGYHPDTDTGDDRLGITADVHMLADLVASRRVVPPLSIGLFGYWGSGKSFFMRRMRARVRELARATAEAERASGLRGPAVSAYCSEIRQVSFNAWHYAESNLWASLAAHLLDNLAASGSDDDLERHADELAERRRHQRSLLDQLSSLRVERVLVAKRLERHGRRAPAPGDIAREFMSALAAEGWAVEGAGPPGDDPARVRAFIGEATGTSAELRRLRHGLVHGRAAKTVAALGAAAAVLVFVLADSVVWPAVTAALTAVVALLPALRRTRASMRRLRRIGDELTARAEAPDRARLAALDAERARIEQAVAELAPSQDLTAFARSRDQSRDYRRHLGVVSLVRRDLETFAAMLAGGPADERGTGPERIVLYIDDLDRCPPDVVVKVLEAVHLLLAQPVFTIVVAADPDWLLRSLNEHYGAVLQGRDAAPDRGARHYLEKIFQVTLTLAPMSGAGFTRLVTSLLRETREGPGPDRPAPPQDDPYRAPVGRHAAEEPRRAAPAATGGAPEADPERPLPDRPHLRPPQLDVTEAELDFIASLAPLVHSPRGAKRLINLYRLLRARLRADELADFLEGPEPGYRAALILLALTAGPANPSALFKAVEGAAAHTTWQDLLAAFPHLDLSADAPADVAAYQRWLPLVRRFAFASGPPDPSPSRVLPPNDMYR